MDTALKHRITGAVILVGLAVLLLPELFSGAGQPPSTTAALQDSDVPLREVQVDLTDGESVDESLIDQVPIPVVAPSTAQAESTVAPPAVTQSPVTPLPEPASAPASVRLSPQESGFFVQVGVFSNRQGAEQVAGGLRSKGFNVRIVTAESAQPLHRVWVGPAKDRAAAEALLRQVRASGQSGMVVSS